MVNGRMPGNSRRAAVALVIAILIGMGAATSEAAGAPGYFACPWLVFFEPCPAAPDPEPAASGPVAPPLASAGPPPTESRWAEPQLGRGGAVGTYLPPTPVRELLEAPTPERAQAYLRWNLDRLRAIARATEVLRVVATSPTASPGAPADAGPTNPACAVSRDAATSDGPSPGARRPPGIHARVGRGGDRDLAGAERGLSVVYAFASWCPYSARQTPIVAAWARSRPGLRLTGVLFDSPSTAAVQFDTLPFPVRPGSRALREWLGVGSYPAVLFLKDGAPIGTVSGLVPLTRLEEVARGLGM
jgi:thiol-disulfide isomerase/thioredoxin